MLGSSFWDAKDVDTVQPFFNSSRNEYSRSISEILYISIMGLATKTLYLPSIACKKKVFLKFREKVSFESD